MNTPTEIFPEEEKDWMLFQLLEGELSPEEEALVREKILTHPDWERAWEQMKNTRLVDFGDDGLSADQKRLLIRPFPLWTSVWQKWSVAAVLFLIAGGIWWSAQREANQLVTEISKTEKKPSPDSTPSDREEDTLFGESAVTEKVFVKPRSTTRKTDQAPQIKKDIDVQLVQEPLHIIPGVNLEDVQFSPFGMKPAVLPSPLMVKLIIRYGQPTENRFSIKKNIAHVQQKINTEIQAFSSPRVQLKRKNEGRKPVFELAFNSAGYEAVARIEIKQELLKPLNNK